MSFPVSIYFSFAQKDIAPYDKGINVTVLVFLLLELMAGVYAVSLKVHSFPFPLRLHHSTNASLSDEIMQAFKILRSQSRKYYLEDYHSGVEKIHTN